MGAAVRQYPKCSVTGRQTTKEEWDRYEEEMKAWKERWEDRKPCLIDFKSYAEYERKLAEWNLEWMDRPNEPGYFRANND